MSVIHQFLGLSGSDKADKQSELKILEHLYTMLKQSIEEDTNFDREKVYDAGVSLGFPVSTGSIHLTLEYHSFSGRNQ